MNIYYCKLVFDGSASCDDFSHYLRRKYKERREDMIPLDIQGNIMISEKFRLDDLRYAFKQYPTAEKNSYAYWFDIITMGEKYAINLAFNELAGQIEVGVNRNSTDSNVHMIQTDFGTRIYFRLDKYESGNISIYNITLLPNSGCNSKSLAGREKYAGFTMAQIIQLFKDLGFHVLEPNLESNEL